MAVPKEVAKRQESISDLVEDLRLLGLDSDQYFDESSMKRARRRRIEDLKQNNGSLTEAYNRIVQDVVRTRDRRSILERHYQKVKEVLKETQDFSGTDEHESVLTHAEECLRDLHNNKYTVLVAGETSAGKSSLINLLLGESILPTHTLATTFTICEISYGKRKEADLYFADAERGKKHLSETDFGKLKEFISKDHRDKDHCERIEIKLPLPFLQAGITIVDSPGAGDSMCDSEKALMYMPQAYAFVYVINSSNAGGVHEDRLLRLLREWNRLYEHNHRGISLKSILFVCNKWDQVENGDKKRVMKDISDKLRKMLEDLDVKRQVINISVKEASLVLSRHGVVRDDFGRLMAGLRRVIPLCIEGKNEYFYGWLSGKLRTLSDQVKAEIRKVKSSQEERIKTRKTVEEKLEKLKRGSSIQEIDNAISNHIKEITKGLTCHLVSTEVKKKFCMWEETDLPSVATGSVEERKTAFERCVSKRFDLLIDEWERKENLFLKAHSELEKGFRLSFFDLEKDFHEIDRTLGGSSSDEFRFFVAPGEAPCVVMTPRTRKFLMATLVFFPVLFPVGLAAGILSAPVFSYLVIQKYVKERRLRNDACGYLAEISREFLEYFINNELRHTIHNEFSEEKRRVAHIKRCHHGLIAKYEQQCQDLTRPGNESQEKETLGKCSTLAEKLREMKQTLLFDAIEHDIHVMNPPCQIDKRSLRYHTDNVLGEGTFGRVLKGALDLPGHDKEKHVAVKELKQPPEPSNIASFLHEATMLKLLNHRNIVTFHGVVVDVRNGRLKSLLLVFDRCAESLKNRIFKNVKYIPCKTPSAAPLTFHWMKSVLHALEFIHGKKIVHRDLKLANVLISEKGRIKVADMGIAAFECRITGTLCGTPLYLAPEVYEGRAYDSKADIYSFSLMMWEMWYGKHVFYAERHMSKEELLRKISRDDYRPQFPLNGSPPSECIELMRRCWERDPSLRPAAWECKDLVKAIRERYTEQDL